MRRARGMADGPPPADVAVPRARLGGGMPQRYSVNAARYASRGGRVRVEEDAQRFLTGKDNAGDMARFYFFCLAFDQIVEEQLTGDFAELGVYRGHTASLLAIMARRLNSTVYLLDTFEGFNAADLKGVDAGIQMGFADTSVEAVRALVGEQNVEFIKGHFPASSTQLPPDGSYCLVHLDCDLYAPMASALEYFYPRLVPGGFLIVHDYSSLHWDGASRAVNEFFADKAESVVPMPDSAGSVIVRKTKTASRFANWYVRKNAALFANEWTPAANGALSGVLGVGWSTPEDWGIWGTGECHQLYVFVDAPPANDVDVEVDVSGFLLEDRSRRQIDIRIDGETIECWIFTPDDNRGIRKLTIPRGCFPTAEDSLPAALVEFRPTLTAVASDVRSDTKDGRRLGMALHRIRRVG